VKKPDINSNLLENDFQQKEHKDKESFKTTNVNILLNRVRSDKKKSLRKKLIFTVILLSSISALIAYPLI
tara:strand:- start:100 stop:309 length:210 start_codon:yes stop_codon:yes gene_type:complete